MSNKDYSDKALKLLLEDVEALLFRLQLIAQLQKENTHLTLKNSFLEVENMSLKKFIVSLGGDISLN